MPAPSQLTIATKAVERLVKEESFYRVEIAKQEQRVRKLETDIQNTKPEDLDENASYVLKQESLAVDETRAVFEPLKQRTIEAVATLEEQIALAESDGSAAADELEKARAILRTGQTATSKND